MSKLSHTDKNGNIKMVDIGKKNKTAREALVSVDVLLNKKSFDLVKADQISKGNVLTAAQLAGIQACKKTSDLIPLCHPIPIEHIDISFKMDNENHKITIHATVKSSSATGVEMEAFCAASIAAITIYDMVKAVQKDVIISDMKLLTKKGGKSGEFNR